MKTRDNFHDHPLSRSGKASWCKKCLSERWVRSHVCKILKQHHEDLKNDPEHLTCDFMKKMCGVDCK
jgi:hypothetical protein